MVAVFYRDPRDDIDSCGKIQIDLRPALVQRFLPRTRIFEEDKIKSVTLKSFKDSILSVLVLYVIGKMRPRGGHKSCKYNTSPIVKKSPLHIYIYIYVSTHNTSIYIHKRTSNFMLVMP